MIEDCDLQEIDFCGYSYTWEKRFKNKAIVEEKLDREFGNSSWCQLFLKLRL